MGGIEFFVGHHAPAPWTLHLLYTSFKILHFKIYLTESVGEVNKANSVFQSGKRMYFFLLPQYLEECSSGLQGSERYRVVLRKEELNGDKQSEKSKNGDEVGEGQFWKLKGYVIAEAPCNKGKSDIFCPRKGAPEKRERKKFGLAKWILVQVS